jgi:pimeloyl-ACP methyl ester carboxylesterase
MAVLALLALAACGAPIHVRPMDSQAVHRALTESVLTTGKPSVRSRVVLQRRGLTARYEHDPESALRELHTPLAEGTARPWDTFALAELSFHHAEHGGGARHYLATAIYAWVYLFATDRTARPDPFDPRFRIASDLYNIGLTKAFQVDGGPEVRLAAGSRPLPFGTIDVALPDEELRWSDRRLTGFVAASELKVLGLRNRYRQPGIGAALAASTGPLDADEGFQDFIFPRVKVPVTAVLRLADAREGLASGRLVATLELHAASGPRVIEIDGLPVPLEIEPTSALAWGLGESRFWRRELEGFRSGDLVTREQRLRLGGLEPFRADRIPVVLVHGTASSPGRWAEMLNDLHNDSRIRERFQFWAFVYDTGNPVVYSGMLLREALAEAVARFDAEGDDACLHQMVVIGHSQGGLLAKLTAVDSEGRFWANITSRPFDDVEMSDEARDLVRRTVFVQPLPFVRRLVFIATPHGGSYRAGAFAQWLVARLTSLPTTLTRTASEILAASPESELRSSLRRMPTSVDNMTPGNPFIRALSQMPIDPAVTAHSIIAVEGSGPFEHGNDGVVAYQSAHIAGVESELVVRSGHSTQSEPPTIEEVRRILLLHAARVRDTSTCR